MGHSEGFGVCASVHTFSAALLDDDGDDDERLTPTCADPSRSNSLRYIDLRKDSYPSGRRWFRARSVRLPRLRSVTVPLTPFYYSIHDPPQRGTQDVVFHSFFTDEQRDGEGKIVDYIGIQKADSPIEFFNE